jgi:phosphate-selective porin OprO/OprP
MKKIILATVLLGMMLLAQSAGAKSLEDILKEKGVITEGDYKEVKKSEPVSYKPGQGFTLLTPDEKFRLNIGGYIQPRYTFTDKEGTEDVSEWKVNRAKFYLRGNAFSKDLTYKLQLEFTKGNSATLLDDAYLSYKFVDEAQGQGGQYKVPYTRQWLDPSYQQEFVERSNATDTFRYGRDAGLMVFGKIAGGIVNYNVGWWGGAGQSQAQTTGGNAYGGRITIDPLGFMPYTEAELEDRQKPLLSVGANYVRDTFAGTRTGTTTTLNSNNVIFAGTNGWLGKNLSLFTVSEKIDVDNAGADIAFMWRGLFIEAEYFFGQATGQDSKTQVIAQGYYAQAGYMIIPRHLEVAARYSYVDPNRDRSKDLHTEIQGAVSYYFFQHALKLQTDFTQIHQDAATKETNDYQWRLQAQIMF